MEPGAKLAHYTILSVLGKGGMGEVWRAQDARLGREVAIKTLPAEFARDAGRLMRFEREAKLLASLNHPNVAAIYGLEEFEGSRFLVLELIEGPTLADRIEHGIIPIDECLRLAVQIAEALEAAHEKGFVHRDLKPANIKVTADNKAKVLDFGLALTTAVESSEADLSNSPTLMVSATQPGVILGTPRYMSPEQARGQNVDKRTDIWSFGAVMYEMVSGSPAFAADTPSDTVAAILTIEPDWTKLPANTPADVRKLLQRCLEKDSRQRLRDIGDARIELNRVIEAQSQNAETPNESVHAERRRSRLRQVALAGAALGVAALLVFFANPLRSVPEQTAAQVVYSTVLLPPGVSVTRGPGMPLSLALSPDGAMLVVAGTDAKGQRLYVRSVNRREATPLAGTEGALTPFFSPDGNWIGFFADRRLKRVPAGGGTAITIADAPGYPLGASWGHDNQIVFSTGYFSPLRIVDADGGTARSLTKVEGLGHLYPEVLPDGRTVLFNEGRWVHALDLASGRRTRLVQGLVPRYIASGHLAMMQGATLLAAPFDLPRLELTGPVFPVIENVAIQRSAGSAPHFAISEIGTMAYVPDSSAYALVLAEPNGSERLLSEDAMLENPQFSPNGKQLVVARTRRAGELSELWMFDVSNASPPFRITSEPARAPIWTLDGASVTFSQPAAATQGIYTKAVDGRGDAQTVVRLPRFHWLVGWTPRQVLAYGMMDALAADGITRSSILAFEEGKSRVVVESGDVWGGRLSPDGRLLAYYSSDTGYFEIYVTLFPDGGMKSLIVEGTDPAWSPDGKEIYYRSGNRLMAARVDTSSGVRVLSHRLVFEPFAPPLYDDYDIHPDGRTLALVRPVGDATGREITWVLNWSTELKRLADRSPGN